MVLSDFQRGKLPYYVLPPDIIDADSVKEEESVENDNGMTAGPSGLSTKSEGP